jgi:hypothetical protein
MAQICLRSYQTYIYGRYESTQTIVDNGQKPENHTEFIFRFNIDLVIKIKK